ncbi:hypothetical protein [Mastigocoleus testarum]|uniref:hypothetical protein n=1 Tax=Mastigocoleus testarum TaxID=996925 RepID=UPI00137997C4|nr:hypothetical protein [Mastigocoleus testarum]
MSYIRREASQLAIIEAFAGLEDSRSCGRQRRNSTIYLGMATYSGLQVSEVQPKS